MTMNIPEKTCKFGYVFFPNIKKKQIKKSMRIHKEILKIFQIQMHVMSAVAYGLFDAHRTKKTSTTYNNVYISILTVSIITDHGFKSIIVCYQKNSFMTIANVQLA